MIRFSFFPLLLAGAATASAVLPAEGQSLRGSSSSVDRMYHHAVDHGIYFYKTGNGIRDAARNGTLTKLTGNADYRVHDVSYPYVRHPVRTFIERLAGQYRRACGERLVVTSAARPKSMRLFNGVSRSVHPAGIAVDVRKPRNSRCRAWLRDTLIALEDRGVIEATEENRPPHFHIAVFPTPYTRYVKAKGGNVYAVNSEGGKYKVRSGDSLWTIARRHETTVNSLKSANGLTGSTLQIGQVLIIP